MMKRHLAVIALALMVGLASVAGSQAPPKETWRQRAEAAGWRQIGSARVGAAPQGTTVIQYDPGAPAGVRSADQGFTFLGNLFNSQSGTPLTGGQVSTVTFYAGRVGAKGSTDMFMRISGAGTTVLSTFIFPAAPYAFNTAVLVPAMVVPPFFVGFFAPDTQSSPLGPTAPQLGFASASYNGQGFHGSQRTFTGSGVAITGQNMVVRVNGSIAIPVELMEFDVD